MQPHPGGTRNGSLCVHVRVAVALSLALCKQIDNPIRCDFKAMTSNVMSAHHIGWSDCVSPSQPASRCISELVKLLIISKRVTWQVKRNDDESEAVEVSSRSV